MPTRVLGWTELVKVAERKNPAARIISLAGVPARVVPHLSTDAGFYVRTIDEDNGDSYWSLRTREEIRLLRELCGRRAVTIDDDIDPWRLDEWHDRLRFEANPRCFVGGCTSTKVDRRGPVIASDPLQPDRMMLACTPHWDAVHAVLGEQARVAAEPAP